jgi:hypothetical protein
MNNDLLQEETSRNYLLVEGSDDAHIFRSLLNHYAQQLLTWIRQLFELDAV